MAATPIGAYLIQQLHDHGIRQIFGIPGDYSLSFIDELLKSPIAFVNTCDEQGAGFAADAYARLGGLGVVCVTYAVGSLKVANAAAQAYAERSPMVIICGAPGLQERARHPFLHHRVNAFETQLEIFRNLTVASVALDNPETAFADIDHALHAAMRHKRPVYIELPRDMVPVLGLEGHTHQDELDISNPGAMAEALQETQSMLADARQPVIIAGVELKRFGLHRELVRFAEQAQIPVAVTVQGKSLVVDDFPLYLGLYAGAIGSDTVQQYVESSDCILLLGAQLTDMDMGMFTANLNPERLIIANTEGVTIRHHSYDVRMGHFIQGLLDAHIPPKTIGDIPHPGHVEAFVAKPGKPITVKRLFQRLAQAIDEQTVVLADIGDAFFGALSLPTRREAGFLASAYYSNMGFAVPGSIGAQVYDRTIRPLVLTGDGSFQMTGMEISTAARLGLNPIVVVLNNHGYATERFFLDGPFNDLQPWEYSLLPEVIGTGKGFLVQTENDLESALANAMDYTEGFAILDVRLPRGDVSEYLQKIGERFGKTVRG